MPFDFFSLIFLFFFLSSFTPWIQRRLLDSQRDRIMQELERKRGSRVIAMIHRQEQMAFLGIPIARYIDIEDSEQILRAIHLTSPEVPIDLILHTPGGLVLAAEQIANALCRHKGKVTVFVPHYAMSGGTLLAMAADEIAMDDNAVLGPVDPQVGQYPAASILSVIDAKPVAEIDDETLILADVSRKAIRQVKSTVEEILVANGMAAEKAAAVAEKLSTGQWTHDYPISVTEAQALGLPVTSGLPPEIYTLMSFYREPTQRRPSVTYVPLPQPYRRDEEPGRSRGVLR